MKTLFTLIFFITLPAFAGDSYVHSYTRHDGTYVEGYHRTTPDNSINNNYGTQGNVNPYTGHEGHVRRRENDSPGEYNNSNGMGRQPSYGSYGYENQGNGE